MRFAGTYHTCADAYELVLFYKANKYRDFKKRKNTKNQNTLKEIY